MDPEVPLPTTPEGLDALIRARVSAAVEPYRDALTIIAGSLATEAAEREWCSEYDEFVDHVNARLPLGIPKLVYLDRRWWG